MNNAFETPEPNFAALKREKADNLEGKFKILDIGLDQDSEADIWVDIRIPKNPPKNCVQADALCLPFRDNIFKLVKSSHVIEHVDNPAAFVKELFRVSSRNVYISTPNRDCFREIFFQRYRNIEDHVFGGFSKEELKKLVARQKIVKMTAQFGKGRVKKKLDQLKIIPARFRLENLWIFAQKE